MAKTVLIIDDDQTLVAPLKDGLESIGYRVAVAFDGLQGILQAHQARPDVIILDFHMPGGGGHTVYERLRQSPESADTPIIFSTVITLDELKTRIRPTNNTFFLRKPVGLNQIIGVLNGVLGETKGALAEKRPAPAPFQAVPEIPKLPPAAAGRPPSQAPLGGALASGVGRPSAPEQKKLARFHEYQVRVSYADTDKMGIIYYANYFKYFEAARTELMRSVGLRWRDLEIQRKIYLPAVEANCKYLKPSRYDALLTVRTWVSHLGRGSVVFENDVLDRDQGNDRVARGYSRHAVVNDLWRSARVPPDIRALLEPFVGVVE